MDEMKRNDESPDEKLRADIKNKGLACIDNLIEAFSMNIENQDVINKVKSMEISIAVWEGKNAIDGMPETVRPFGFISGEISILEDSREDCEKNFLAMVQEKYRKICGHARVEKIRVTEPKGIGCELNVLWVIALQEESGKKSDNFIGCVVIDVLARYLSYRRDLKCLWDFKQEEFEKWCLENKFDFMSRYIQFLKQEIKIPDIDIITKIALQKYETRENDARIYFVNAELLAEIKESEFIKIAEKSYLENGFEEEKNISGIRKLLEACKGSRRCLVAKYNDKEYYDIVGILLNDNEIKRKCEVVSIYFKGNEWNLSCGQENLLKYKNNSYYIDEQSNRLNLEADCEEKGLDREYARLFEKVRDSVPHGALIIVAEDAEEESDILCITFKRGTRIEKVLINEDNEDLLLGMASIDGAVFLDEQKNCYGFGIILDGIARVVGEVGNGSRYNSAANYIFNTTKRRWAAVFSEDKDKGITIVSQTDENIRIEERKANAVCNLSEAVEE